MTIKKGAYKNGISAFGEALIPKKKIQLNYNIFTFLLKGGKNVR